MPISGKPGGGVWGVWIVVGGSVVGHGEQLACAVALHFACDFDAVFRPGLGVESRFTDAFASGFADAVGFFRDPDKRFVDLRNNVAIGFDETKREFLLVVVGTDIRHMDGHVRERRRVSLKGFFGHGTHVADDFSASEKEGLFVFVEFSFGEVGFDRLEWGLRNIDRSLFLGDFFGGLLGHLLGGFFLGHFLSDLFLGHFFGGLFSGFFGDLFLGDFFSRLLFGRFFRHSFLGDLLFGRLLGR